MFIVEGELFHVFNRGNNREVIFPRRRNYYYFIDGVGRYLAQYCDILAWCLMPNHFHFLIHGNPASTQIIRDGSFERQRFSQGIKQLLSSYTKGINRQDGRTGSLFQQNTKCLQVSYPEDDYSLTAFHYIHQNPVRAGIAKRMEDWEFSSFKEYLGCSKINLCNKELAVQLLDLRLDRFREDSYLAARQVSYIFKM